MVSSEPHAGGQHPDCFEQDEADRSPQHSDELLQEFYAMTQKHNESIGKYAVRLDMAASKVWLQSQELWVALLMNERG